MQPKDNTEAKSDDAKVKAKVEVLGVGHALADKELMKKMCAELEDNLKSLHQENYTHLKELVAQVVKVIQTTPKTTDIPEYFQSILKNVDVLLSTKLQNARNKKQIEEIQKEVRNVFRR